MGLVTWVIGGAMLTCSAWSASAPLSNSPSQSVCEIPPPNEGPWKPVVLMFRRQAASTAGKPSCSSWDCVPKQSAEFLFASIADPEQTRLTLHFNRTLESLLWAIEDSGYVLESHWLPWTAVSERVPSSLADQECARKQKQWRRSQPGLLAFRRKSIPDHFLFVWLLGETPTSGIDQAMLANAIAYSRNIDPGLKRFRLVGPNFPGSLAPLAHQIAGLASEIEGAHIVVVSGATTDYGAIEQFSAHLKNHGGNLATFESSIENDQRATTLFLEYMRTQLICPATAPFVHDETAILSEDETVYGDLGLAPKLDSPTESHGWMILRYPREIGRLRRSNAQGWPSALGLPHESSDQGTPPASSDALASRSEARPEVGEIPDRETEASQRAALQAVAATLRREHASYTGIIAKDVLDSVFLARFLHTADPDTRLFTVDSDLLFLGEGETEPLLGMLCVTNYPLFSRNQHWTEGEPRPGYMPRRVQFASRYAQGIYNACRRVLLAADAMDGEEQDVQPAPLMEYAGPAAAKGTRAPLWLTVVGRDGYWPVALLDQESTAGSDQSTITSISTANADARGSPGRLELFHPEEPSRGWTLLFYCACLFCFGHVLYMANILRLGDDKGAVSTNAWPIRFLHHVFSVYPDDHRPSDEERPYLLTATLSLFSSLLLFAFPLFPFRAFTRYFIYFLVAAICLGCLLWIAVRLMKGRIVYLRIVILAWVLSIPFLGGWIYLILQRHYGSGNFFAYRALFLGNGVSPGIPIVLLAVAFYGWAWVHLHRESEVRNRREHRPEMADQPWPEEIRVRIQETDRSIEDVLSPEIWKPAFCFLCLWFLVLYPPESLRTFEHYYYDVLYACILTAVYWCISLVWIQFIRVWRQLKKLLEALERHPIRHAFSRLDKEISWIPLVSTVPARSLVVSTRSMDCLRSLHTLTVAFGRSDPEIEKAVSDAESVLNTSYGSIRKKVSAGQSHSDNYREFQHELDRLAQHMIRQVTPDWERGHSESVTNELQRRNQTDPLDDRGRITILQEEFIALRLLLYIRYVLRQLRNWLGFLIGGFMISIISMNSYPFQAHRWIGLASLITFLTIGTGVGMVFAEMDRDAILSRITYTKANRVGTAFFLRLGRFGALPFLTVLAAQYPSVNRALFFWVKPVFDALK